MLTLAPRNFIRTGLAAVIVLGVIYLVQPFTPHRSQSHGSAGSRTAQRASSWSGGVREWVQSGWNGPAASASEAIAPGEDDWVDLDRSSGMPVTLYEGGIHGYQVFSNLYLHESVLTAVRSKEGQDILPDCRGPESEDTDEEVRGSKYNDGHQEDRWPGVQSIMTGEQRGAPAGENRWRVVEERLAREELGKRAYKLGGVTYIFNDAPGPDGYLVYFRHFVLEAFLGATRILASTLPDGVGPVVPQRVWFPRCGADPSWRDDRGENPWFLARALPSASVEDKSGWEDRHTAGLPILLEKVVIVDRWSSHSSKGEVDKWGKMNAAVPHVAAPQSFWSPYRANMMRSLGVDGVSKTGSRGLPVVVYIDRQTETPKMRPADHDALVGALKGLTEIAEVHVAKVSAMSKARQVDLMSRAQIVISLHGDELFNLLWMPTEGSTVIGLFEKSGFIRDFELLASSLNHKYILIRHDKVVSAAAWRESGTGNGPERQTGEISIDADVVVKVVRDHLGGTTEKMAEIDDDNVCAVDSRVDC
ncbi:hypothetical protein IAU60_001857 [Kwoniella sp. DSM 27419]